MHFFRWTSLFTTTLLPFFTAGAKVPVHVLQQRQSPSPSSPVPDPQCTYGPKNRACWTNGYSIATDFDQKFPTTGNTVTYNLDITNGTCDPDGNGARMCLLFNGQYPGPTLRATWGDTMVVNVKNSMPANGTSVHWHGVRQYHSTGDDGVNGITECALAPGDSKIYTFQVTQFGTSWYHSHFSSQYGEGTVGGMIFDGPASGNYDEDLGMYPVTDWFYTTAFYANWLANHNLQTGQGGPPPADTILINGTNKNAAGGGQYNQVSIQTGKTYRLRLVNTAVDAAIRVSLDSHLMKVIASDFIPVHPFYTETLLLGIGQRYDVIIEANQTAGSYWFRADYAKDCVSDVKHNALAIWTYDDKTISTPNSTAYPVNNPVCLEPAVSPYWYQPVPSGNFESSLGHMSVNFTTAQIIPGQPNVVVWALNAHTIDVDWADPTLTYIRDGNISYPADLSIYPTENEGQWNYWLIQQGPTVPPLPHPVHLHGHDFFVLGQNSGTFDVKNDMSKLNFDTPPRRDTAFIPANGWLALAFNSNNPGAWLMHCHIAFHISQGLGMQFVESPDKIVMPPQDAYDQTCNNWKKYAPASFWHKDDSGL